MLHGELVYKPSDGTGEVSFEVYVSDSFDVTKISLKVPSMETCTYEEHIRALSLLDTEYGEFRTKKGKLLPEDEIKSMTEELSVFPSFVQTSETTYRVNRYENESVDFTRRLDVSKTSKFKTNIPNKDFCTKVASILLYMQIQGRKDYNQNITMDEHDHFNTKRRVDIDDIGFIEYDMGLIQMMAFNSKYVAMKLVSIPNDAFEGGMFKELKKEDRYGRILSVTPISNIGFKLSESNLGFPYIPAVEKEKVNLFGMYETIEEVIEANPEKNTDWILKRDYNIVSDDNLDEVLKRYQDFNGYIALDFETTGLAINFKSRTGEADQVVGVVLSDGKGRGDYFPLQHKLFKNLCGGDHHYFMEKYMRPLLEKKKLIGHNIKFDWKCAYVYDINANFIYDTMLAFGVTKRYEEGKSFKLGLKELVKTLFGLDMFDLSDFVLASSFGDSDITFADLAYELVRRYAPADGDMTLTLFEYIEHTDLINRYDARRIFDEEVTFAMAAAYAEFYGYHVEVPNVPAMRDDILNGMKKYEQQMFKIAGREFNPNSSTQLATIMYDELGIEERREKRTTNKEVLKELNELENLDGTPRYPFVAALMSYRKYEGIHKNFLKKLHLYSTPDGFIFSTTQALGTDTGRTSAKDPNYQGYNDAVKKNITPRAGFISFDCDFSQIEYRVLASLAKQVSLINEFNDADLDYHTYQASRMFGIPYSLVSKDLRGQSKGINFGLPYGMGDSSLGARIFGDRNKETEAKAKLLRKKFFQGQELIEEFFEKVRDEGVNNGFTSTYWGRRRYYQKAKFTNAEIRRQAGNHVIQGTAADIYKIACNRMFKRIIAEGWLGKVLINVFVHDELLMEVHESINLYYFFKAWREEFQVEVEGFCTLYAGAGVGKSWYSAKKQDLPPQYIEDIINQYTPDMEWDGDTDGFLKSVEQGYEDYKIRRVKEYITDPNNDGELMKPIINALLVEVSSNIAKEVSSSEDADKKIEEYNAYLGDTLILSDGTHKLKSLDNYLKTFCMHYDLDRSKINILSPDEATLMNTNDEEDDQSIEEFLEDLDDYELTPKDLVMMSGFHIDYNTRKIYLRDMPYPFQGQQVSLIRYLNDIERIFVPEGAYSPLVYDTPSDSFKEYPIKVTSDGLSAIMRSYAVAKSLIASPFGNTKVTF